MNITDLTNNPQFRDKLGDYARKVGKTAARPVLLLYYVLKSPSTPASDKAVIVAALSYIVLPIDIIPASRIPIIGWLDEAAAVMYAYKKVSSNINPDIERQADEALEKWFPGGATQSAGA
ncbi:MAG: DUF1232 domain-containing protein [Tannerellaceae bacterium]|jgi:uncharacterized membrane protein YkvA (DUF1232 family)|nr:DUF1232 domain-containing protein [Tannerellaceae bacterium]